MSPKHRLILTAYLCLGLLLSGCGAAPNPAASPVVAPTAPTSPVSTAPTPPVTPPPTARAAVVFTMTNDAVANAVLAFTRQPDGSLVLAGAYPTGGRGTGGALGNQAALAFSTDRKLLFVVNPGSNDFTIFQVAAAGLTLASRTPSGGAHPISISEHSGTLYVLNLGSNAGAPGIDCVSGFRIDTAGQATPIPNSTRPLSASSTTAAQVAVCWLAISPDGRFAFTGNTTASSVSAYAIRSDASVSLLQPNGLSATTDGGALDLTVSSDSKYLYVVLTNGTLENFAIDSNGGLRKVQSLPSLAAVNGVISL